MNKLIVGNWKMFPTLADSQVLAASLKRGLDDLKGVDVVLAPPLPWLVNVKEIWPHKVSHISLAAQNIWPEDQGAFTGEVSAYLLKDIIRYAIVGHSERRRYNQEDNDLIGQKIQACLKWRITPIVCVGEKKRVLFADGTVDSTQWRLLEEELMEALEGISKDVLEKIVVAYEPVWAVGNNNPAKPEYAVKLIERLRVRVAEKYGQTGAQALRFLYGGSVDVAEATDYLRYPDIAGLLVGTASVKAKNFLDICRQASHFH